METCVIIPTFWTRRRTRGVDRGPHRFDHPTPVDQDGTLPACLRSLESVDGLERVVITVAAGFPTTVAPIVQFGAVPVFVDITLPTYNVDCSQLEAARSEKTKAVMLAHTLGNLPDADDDRGVVCNIAHHSTCPSSTVSVEPVICAEASEASSSKGASSASIGHIRLR